MKKLLIIALAIGLTSCSEEEEIQPTTVCMKCTLTSPIAIGGGNPALWPGEQEMCGTQAEIDLFEALYYDQVYDWKQSWTGPIAVAAGNYTANCDQY
jgi:hypothetical protein